MLADTSFLVALLHEDDPHHKRAVAARSKQPGVQIQQTALVETLQVVRFAARTNGTAADGRNAERHALRLLVDALGCRIVSVDDVATARRLHETHPALSFVDCCGIADARAHGGLLTFDKEQERLAKSL